ncbi:hypothetical protein EW640_09825 [Brevibacterium luteolum]|uniref:Integrase catalytic domain-containing protein n=1 Tax=Brevibacterium luteolum TaxID=199591 RepID=A0A6G8L0W1_9MICO|nr:integrase core domain-containing protein [Brevibacterium luteolum]QIN30536.1 hypothetical protein EW640_09825 [Brevibacterium luteolum]
MAESFNAALKRGLLEGRPAFPDHATACCAVFWCANRYSTRRLHSAIGNIAPRAYETRVRFAHRSGITETTLCPRSGFKVLQHHTG